MIDFYERCLADRRMGRYICNVDHGSTVYMSKSLP